MPAVETITTKEAEAEAALAAEDGADESIDAVRDFHRAIAKKIWPRGAVLRCQKCGKERTASVVELTTFLGHGWPTCHGETMHIGEIPRSKVQGPKGEQTDATEKVAICWRED